MFEDAAFVEIWCTGCLIFRKHLGTGKNVATLNLLLTIQLIHTGRGANGMYCI